MEIVEILRKASLQVYNNIKDMVGTEEANFSYGRGAGGDISKEIDIVAEKSVIDYFKKINFECVVLGEECGRIELSKKPKGFVIMDAIDGTTNAVRGLPFFCCSLAFSTKEKLSSVKVGVIIDLTSRDIYYTTKGNGAYYNNKRIYVNDKKIDNTIISINTSRANSESIQKLQPIFEKQNHIRHLGSSALELAFFARGMIDIFLDLRLKIRFQDIAAGYLLIKEAGGLILDSNLNALDCDFNYSERLSFIATTNKNILTNVLKSALGGI